MPTCSLFCLPNKTFYINNGNCTRYFYKKVNKTRVSIRSRPCKIFITSGSITVQHLAVVSHTVSAREGRLEISGTLEPTALDGWTVGAVT